MTFLTKLWRWVIKPAMCHHEYIYRHYSCWKCGKRWHGRTEPNWTVRTLNAKGNIE